jgi:hypothetical protein
VETLMASINPPLLLAVVLCDHIIREAGTNKYSLIGIFNMLFVRQLPCTHASLAAYIALTDGRGQVPAILRLVEVETGKEVLSARTTINFQDPTAVAELALQIPNVRFESLGEYALEFHADGELLGSRKLRVLMVKPPGPTP